jgi:hypothetical protein
MTESSIITPDNRTVLNILMVRRTANEVLVHNNNAVLVLADTIFASFVDAYSRSRTMATTSKGSERGFYWSLSAVACFVTPDNFVAQAIFDCGLLCLFLT